MNRPWKDEAEYDRWRDRIGQGREDELRSNVRGFACLDPGGKPIEWRSGLLWGPAGVGKTRMASRMVRSVPDEGCFITVRDFVSISRKIEFKEADRDEEQWVTNCYVSGYLVLDDLATRVPSDFVYDTIYGLIDARVKRNTIITSNVDLATIAKIYDDRVASRIASFGEVRHLAGRDWRVPETRG